MPTQMVFGLLNSVWKRVSTQLITHALRNVQIGVIGHQHRSDDANKAHAAM